jgi:ABC-type sugar transport system substrate-binding protein
MKIERTSPPRGPRSVAATAYARAAAAAAPASEAGPIATVMGIPEAEFTPRVREAIMALMEEVESLRRELAGTRTRLTEAEKEADRDQMLPVLNRR